MMHKYKIGDIVTNRRYKNGTELTYIISKLLPLDYLWTKEPCYMIILQCVDKTGYNPILHDEIDYPKKQSELRELNRMDNLHQIVEMLQILKEMNT